MRGLRDGERVIEITESVKLPLLFLHCHKELLDTLQSQLITGVEVSMFMEVGGEEGRGGREGRKGGEEGKGEGWEGGREGGRGEEGKEGGRGEGWEGGREGRKEGRGAGGRENELREERKEVLKTDNYLTIKHCTES